MKDLSPDLILQEDGVDQIVDIMKTAKPLNDFLRRALS